ncbi:ATP-binding protein [Sulfuriferula thiophila]|uniref:ATP-binding protein n=1 Tax=Sulfuriferula thiophila TaxID=1781211 RepID=UPI001674D4B9|nr:ATP-binding protein [Sulfuriferula thiophila]
MDLRSGNFDSELSLHELLSGVSPERLTAILTLILGTPFRLVSTQGELVMGIALPFEGDVSRAPLSHDLETIAYIESPSAEPDKLSAAVILLELLLQSGARYFMAAKMHIEVVQSDYEALQRKHTLLQESEARYKILAAHLEERVEEQVKTIDAAQRQLYQAEKMASVGQLAAGVAHEINNPIGFIRSNLSTAQSYVQKLATMAGMMQSQGSAQLNAAWRDADLDFVLEDFAALLEESVSGADRVARIVADLKGFSNVDHAEEEIVNLNDNLRSVCNVAASQLQGRADLELELGELPPLRCLPGQLNQVLLNLLLNAAQAMTTPGKIRIRTAVDNAQISVTIADTGKGIPAEVLPRIFEPFYTTRDVGQGTGLGLTVSRDVIVAHGGHIEVESQLGAGTTFTIYLPVANADHPR